jgi:hypothetical protein
MKWFLLAVTVALIAGLYVWQHHSTKTAYVNGLPLYRDLPNSQFIFERDCYIFKLKSRDTDWPLVADHSVVADLPEAVSASNIGADLPGVRILDVAHIGDRFKIVSVRQDTRPSGTHISFEILFLDEASRKYGRLDADLIMDHSPEARGLPPTLLPEFAIGVAHPSQ